MGTERQSESKYHIVRGCYSLQRAEAIHLAAQKFESPFIRLSRSGEQYLTSGISKPDLSSNQEVRVPKVSTLVPEGSIYLQIEIRRGEDSDFWKEVDTILDSSDSE